MSSGTLFVIATPIGNMKDFSARAIEVIKNLDCLAAEDTRRAGMLLANYGISVKLTSLHDHNEKDKSEYIIEQLKEAEYWFSF